MGYTNSSMVVHTRISPNRNVGRANSRYNPSGKIDKITIHHMAGNLSIETCGNVFQSRQASSNYGIGSDGRVGMYCEEKDRSWCSSSPSNDYRAVTIEVANCDTGGDWPVSDKAYATLIKLCVDICKRNGISSLNYTGDANGNLTRHNMFEATSCPGPYLQARFAQIAREVNAQLNSTPTPAPTPTPSGSVKVGDVVDFLGGNHYSSSNASSAAASVKAGKAKVTQIYNGKHPYHLVHTDGASAVYGWVDASQIKQLQQPEPTPAPSDYAVGDIVYFKGGNHYTNANAASGSYVKAGPAKVTQVYNGKHPYHVVHTDNQSAVYGWVDASSLSKSAPAPTPAPQPAKKTNEQIAQEVIRGDWGNGQDRKNRLIAAGYDYNAIQDIVNGKVSATPAKKSNETIAREVIRGDWGNGAERKQRLAAAGYDYSTIQSIVNKLL